MARTVDLMGVGMPAEEANRAGSNGPQYVTTSTGSLQSTATIIGGPNGANIISFNASANAAFTFSSTTEIGDQFILTNVGTTVTIFTATGGTWMVGSATASVGIASGKSLLVTRFGPEAFPAGSVVSDLWIYTLSA